MLKYFVKNTANTTRIKKLETEVEGLKGELDYLRNQNLAMIESLENINKYEKILIEKIEEMASELLNITEGAKDK